jgi:hypothetical protein
MAGVPQVNFALDTDGGQLAGARPRKENALRGDRKASGYCDERERLRDVERPARAG